MISAYRIRDGVTEAQASFHVPVYLTVPHKTLAGQSGYYVGGTVRSFGVQRNYVNVPVGTNLVKVTLQVPAAAVQGTSVTGCAAVELMANEGGNTIKAPELTPRTNARARNCSAVGVAGGPLSISYTRAKPTPGIWDLHVFGLYQFTNSPYLLSVEYAKITATPSSIAANTTTLNGSLDVNVVDASFPIVVSGPKSKYALSGFRQVVSATVAQDQDLKVPDADGAIARSYGADIGTVTIGTGDSTGNDIDLTIRQCDDAALTTGCKDSGSSGGATDIESVTFKPAAGKFYYAVVSGYAVTANGGVFKLTETQTAKAPEAGAITATQTTPTSFKLDYTFPAATSAILAAPRFTTGKYSVVGEIAIADAGGVVLVRVPVNVTAN
jgi:hypothetical protein